MFTLLGIILAAALFVTMIICIVAGQQVGKRKPPGAGFNIAEGAVFTLVGLLLAFMLSSSSGRLDHRRAMILEEENEISTAYLRLSILKPEDQIILKKDFLNYVISRLAIYQAIPDMDKVSAELQKSDQVQKILWDHAVTACQNSGVMTAPMLILTVINAMFDMAQARVGFTGIHLNQFIIFLLLISVLLSSFLAGYGIADKDVWRSLHIIAYVFITTLTVYIIIDLEYPRFGLIQETHFDKHLMDLRDMMQKDLGMK
jgi:hypothetical protein